LVDMKDLIMMLKIFTGINVDIVVDKQISYNDLLLIIHCLSQ